MFAAAWLLGESVPDKLWPKHVQPERCQELTGAGLGRGGSGAGFGGGGGGC